MRGCHRSGFHPCLSAAPPTSGLMWAELRFPRALTHRKAPTYNEPSRDTLTEESLVRIILLVVLLLSFSVPPVMASVEGEAHEAAMDADDAVVAETQALANVSLIIMALGAGNIAAANQFAENGYYNAVTAALAGGHDAGEMWDIAASFIGYMETGEYTYSGFSFDTDGVSWLGSDGTEWVMDYAEFGPWLTEVTRRPDPTDIGETTPYPGSDPWSDHGPGEGGGESGDESSAAAFGGPADPLGLDGPGVGPGSKRHPIVEYDW